MKVHERYWGIPGSATLVSNAGLDSKSIPKTKVELMEWIQQTKEKRKNDIQTLQLILQSTCETFHPNQILNHFQPEKRTYKKATKKSKKQKDMDDVLEPEIRPNEKDIEKDLDSCRSHSCRSSRDDCEDSCRSPCEDLDEYYEGDISEESEESLDDIIEEDMDML